MGENSGNEWGDIITPDVEIIDTYSDEEFFIEFYADNTFRGLAMYQDTNMDGVMDESDIIEFVGDFEVDYEACEVRLNSDLFKAIYEKPLTLYIDMESGKLYR